MKLYYDKRLKDPIYYAQQGFRNGKKTTDSSIQVNTYGKIGSGKTVIETGKVN